MIALWGILLGVVIGFARRGKLENLGAVRLRGVWLVFFALAIQLLIFPTSWWAEPPISRATSVWHVGSYAMILAFLLVNRRIVHLWGIALGILMNLSAITANGGYMPTSLDALRASGRSSVVEQLLSSSGGSYGNVVVMSETTRLNFLGDWLSVPPWIPLGGGFSPGDLVLMIGVAWLIQSAMAGPDRKEDEEETSAESD